MPSPFPGMDPYLEGYVWPDVHHRLATEISDQLTPQLRPRYAARIEIQMVVDESPQAEIGIVYPDVEIVRSQRQQPTLSQPPTPQGAVLVAEAPAITPAAVTVQWPEIEVRLASVRIYDVAQNQLVTSIEILSPVNKREPGLSRYREKWQQLRNAGVHLLEIDLLRRGQRPLEHPRIPDSHYRMTLARVGSHTVQAWTIHLQDKLPVLPVPLRPPDADVRLNLAQAMTAIYDRAAYDLSIDYSAPPPPPELTAEESAWAAQQIAL